MIRDKRAALLRGHGVVIVGRDIEEALFSSLIFEDDAQKTLQAASLGEVGLISLEECNAFDGEDGLQRRSHRTWDYFAGGGGSMGPPACRRRAPCFHESKATADYRHRKCI